MCGRGRCSLAPEHIEDRVRIPRERWQNPDRYQASYNIGPGGWLPIIRNSENTRILQTAKWGLIPSYTKKDSKPDSFRMFNARSERLAESPVFRRLLSTKRCVVLMNGFYEWKKESSTNKQPYYIHRGEGNLIKFAGLFDEWETEEGVVCSTTIITTDSGSKLKWLHGRMPVILPNNKAVDLWLSTEDVEWKELDSLLVSYNGEDLEYHPVTNSIGKLSFQGEECCVDIRTHGLSAFCQSTDVRGTSMEEDSKANKAQRNDTTDEDKLTHVKRRRVDSESKTPKFKSSKQAKKVLIQKKLTLATPVKKASLNKRQGEDMKVSMKKKPKLENAAKVDIKEESGGGDVVQTRRRSSRLASKSP